MRELDGTDNQQRVIEWKCPFCGITARVPKDFETIRCHAKCGAVIERGGHVAKAGSGFESNPDIVHARQTTCLFCDRYLGNERCRDISDGCRVAYYVKLYLIDPWCERWQV